MKIIKNFLKVYSHHETGKIYHLTPKKILNAMLTKADQKLLRSKPLGMPLLAIIEPTNICNLRCPLCPTGKGIVGRSKGMLEWNLFKKFADELGGYLINTGLNNWGESMINPQLYQMIAYLKK